MGILYTYMLYLSHATAIRQVHPLDPADDDDQKLAREARTAFCDVRFDCIDSKPGARTAPKQARGERHT